MSKRVLAGVAVLAVLFGAPSSANAEAYAPSLGGLMWTAFECATFDENAGDEDEQRRLFLVGYDAGKKLLERIEDEQTRAPERARTPVSVLLRLNGPSVDFIIGRIFESAINIASDKILYAEGEIQDSVLWPSIAERHFRDSNCGLLH